MPGLERSLGHLETNQVVGNQSAPELLVDALDGLTAKGQLPTQHRLFPFTVAGLNLPATFVAADDGLLF